MNASTREGIWFHILFFFVAASVLLFARDAMLGKGLLLLVLGYNLLLPAVAFVRRHPEWLALWAFLLPLSAAQVLPDLALANVAKVLVFPDLGQFRIGGAVPVYFMGMWTMLLFPLLLIGNSTRSRYLNTGVMAFISFTFWEWAARQLQLWHAQDVLMSHGIALYVLVPEVLLCLTALWMYRLTGESGILARFFGALSVSVFYAGALFISLALIG